MNPVIAYVQIGPVEIAYSRSGRGAPLVFVASEAVKLNIAAGLSEHFCVISPLDASSQTANATWLREFLDALGLPPPRVVADNECAAASVELMLEDPGALDRLAVLCGGRSSSCAQLSRGVNARLLHIHLAAEVLSPEDFAALLRFLR
jgi:hypothetical protein